MPNAQIETEFHRYRVDKLIAGRLAGLISLKEFKRKIEDLSTQELAQLAVAVLTQVPGRPKGTGMSLNLVLIEKWLGGGVA